MIIVLVMEKYGDFVSPRKAAIAARIIYEYMATGIHKGYINRANWPPSLIGTPLQAPRMGRDPSSLWETVTRLHYMAAHCVPQCPGPLMGAQTPSGMFVTPLYGRDGEISSPNGSIWGDMCPGCALFPDLEGLMGHQSLLSDSISGLWASTQLCYGQGK